MSIQHCYYPILISAALYSATLLRTPGSNTTQKRPLSRGDIGQGPRYISKIVNLVFLVFLVFSWSWWSFFGLLVFFWSFWSSGVSSGSSHLLQGVIWSSLHCGNGSRQNAWLTRHYAQPGVNQANPGARLVDQAENAWVPRHVLATYSKVVENTWEGVSTVRNGSRAVLHVGKLH